MCDIVRLWAEREAQDVVRRLMTAYDSGIIASTLYGQEFTRLLETWLADSVKQRTSELAATTQGLEAEMRRARDVLPPDWDNQRFEQIVRGELVPQ